MEKYFGHKNPFDVYITPLHNRETSGEWVSFPTTPETLRDVFRRLEIGPDEWAISNINCNVYGINGTLMETNSLDELNHLACKLEELTDDEFQQYQVVIEIDRHCDTVPDLINLCDNLDCYDFYPDITDDEELGRHQLFEESELHRNTLNEIADYIDFERYGEDHRENDGGMFADHCYIVPSGYSFTEYYRGEIGDIPEENLVTTQIEVPELTDDERLDRCIELAIDLDNFFRAHDPQYASQYPDDQEQKEAICDDLFDGKIAAIDARLSDMGQDENDVLPMEIAKYKAAIRYDPAQDTLPEPEKMRVLVVEPRQAPYLKEIDNGLEALQAEVGGPIAATYPFEDMVALVCNDEAQFMGMELNRALYDESGRVYDIVPGTFLIVGLDRENFASLDDALADKFTRRFQNIEVFAKIGDRTVMFQVPQDHVKAVHEKATEREAAHEGRRSIHDRLAAAKKECTDRPGVPHTKDRSEPSL